jgi:hypothetical protein
VLQGAEGVGTHGGLSVLNFVGPSWPTENNIIFVGTPPTNGSYIIFYQLVLTDGNYISFIGFF